MSRNTPGGSDPATISKLRFLVPGVYKLTNSEKKILVTVNIIFLKDVKRGVIMIFSSL